MLILLQMIMTWMFFVEDMIEQPITMVEANADHTVDGGGDSQSNVDVADDLTVVMPTMTPAPASASSVALVKVITSLPRPALHYHSTLSLIIYLSWT